MYEKYSLQWLGIKAEGLITVLFGMGAILHFTNVMYPIGSITMILAIIFLAIDIIITLDDKAKKIKRGY